MENIGEQLGDLYREWNQKLLIAGNRALPLKERMEAMRWINRQTGVTTPPDELEDVANYCDQNK